MQLNLSTAKTYATRAIACLQVGALYLVGTAAFSSFFVHTKRSAKKSEHLSSRVVFLVSFSHYCSYFSSLRYFPHCPLFV